MKKKKKKVQEENTFTEVTEVIFDETEEKVENALWTLDKMFIFLLGEYAIGRSHQKAHI